MALEPTLQEVIAEAIESRLLEIHTCTIGQVKEYDAATQRAVVFPVVQRVDYLEDVGRVSTALPGLFSVPVVWPRAGGYALHFPLKQGDHVLLVFAETDTSNWRENPMTQANAAAPDADLQIGVRVPHDLRRHSLGSAFAIPGVFPDRHPIADAPTDHAVLIVPDGGKLRVSTANGSGVEAVALAEKVAAQLTTLKQAISGAAVVALDGGASFKAAIMGALADWPGDVGSKALEVE